MSASGSDNPEVPPTEAPTKLETEAPPKRAFKDVRPSGKQPAKAAKTGKVLGKKAKALKSDKFEAVTELPSGIFSHTIGCSHCGSGITVDSGIPLTFSRGPNKSPGHRFVTKTGGTGAILVVALCVRCNNGLLQKIEQGLKEYLRLASELASMPDLLYRAEHASQWKIVNEEKKDDLIESLKSLRAKRQEFLNSGENHVEEIEKLDKTIFSRFTQIEELRALIMTTPDTPDGIAREKARLSARKEEIEKLMAEYRWKIRKYNNVREDGMAYTNQDFSVTRRIGVPSLDNPTIVTSVDARKVSKATPAPAASAAEAEVEVKADVEAEVEVEEEETEKPTKVVRRRAAPRSWDE
jgi:hypothetical protein